MTAWLTIGILVYLAIGTCVLFCSVAILTNEKAQRKSRLVQRIWTLYEMNPALTLAILFVIQVFLWLPIGFVGPLLHSKKEKQEMDEITDELKDSLGD